MTAALGGAALVLAGAWVAGPGAAPDSTVGRSAPAVRSVAAVTPLPTQNDDGSGGSAGSGADGSGSDTSTADGSSGLRKLPSHSGGGGSTGSTESDTSSAAPKAAPSGAQQEQGATAPAASGGGGGGGGESGGSGGGGIGSIISQFFSFVGKIISSHGGG